MTLNLVLEQRFVLARRENLVIMLNAHIKAFVHKYQANSNMITTRIQHKLGVIIISYTS